MNRLPLKINKLLFALLYCILFAAPNIVHSKEFSSGIEKVSLLELYTSQGCSSCPPAEAWFSKLKEHPQLWRKLVPVAFHVDYWNYLGWRDVFSDAAYSYRQRSYKNSRGITTYTPGFILAGKEWRGFFGISAFGGKPSIYAKEPSKEVGNLTVDLTGNSFRADFAPTQRTEKHLVFHIAILGFNLTTDIQNGENSGKDIAQDFVVLNYEQYGSSNNAWQDKLKNIPSKDSAIAVWVSTPRDPAPIQALGGLL